MLICLQVVYWIRRMNMSDLNKQDWVCGKCGTLNSEGNFCCECGEPKPATPAVPVVPAPKEAPKESEEDKKNANLLCIFSLLCMFAAPGIAGIVMKVAEVIFYGGLEGIVTTICGTFAGFGWIAGIVLMIMVRVKYKDNTFGKVLMWLYIALAIIAVIIGMIVLFTVIACLNECNRGMW